MAPQEGGPPACRIAVVGLGCWLPGAPDPQTFWQNVLARRCQFRRFRPTRLGADNQDPAGTDPDKTYATRGAFIDGWEFDWKGKRIPKKCAEITDPVQWLSLDVALQAVADAGGTLPPDDTCVVIGNSLTGEVSRSNNYRLRWPYVERVMKQVLGDTAAVEPEVAASLLKAAEEVYKGTFPPPNEDMLAGTLSNTIAGRVANYMNLRGGCWTVDGACSAGLLAIDAACARLASGASDAAIAGGVDMSLDVYEMTGFSRIGALTRSEMRVYSEGAAGFIGGEGCVMVVLKRLEDAVREGHHVYAVIEGIAASSDGKGPITAPTIAGQSLAISRAYAMAGLPMDSISFVEGHGTGTKAGDPVELRAVSTVLKRHQAEGDKEGRPRKRVGMTSAKSLIGHTKAASGAVGFLKAVCALNQRVVPPTFNVTSPNPVFADGADCDCLYPVLDGEARPADEQMRAGISSMGFGGINAHAVLSSFSPPSAKLAPPLPTTAMLASSQLSELFVFSANSAQELAQQVAEVRQYAGELAYCELADLAADLARRCAPGRPLRLALLAVTPFELEALLDEAAHYLATRPLPPGTSHTHALSPKQRFWVGHSAGHPRVGFLFPGQGSQLLNAARRIVKRCSWAQALVESADQWLAEAGCDPISPSLFVSLDGKGTAEAKALQDALADTRVAQPAVALASLLWQEYLGRLGLAPAVVAGHSLGELSALAAAGGLTPEALIKAAGVRGQLMARSPEGAMAALRCSAPDAEAIIAEAGAAGSVWVANRNTPAQTVVSGSVEGIEAVVAAAKARPGVSATRLAVSGAFHCPKQADAAAAFSQQLTVLADEPVLPAGTTPVVSTLTGQPLAPGTPLAPHLGAHLAGAVDFVGACAALRQHADIFLEVGPGKVVSGLFSANAGAGGPAALPLEPAASSCVDLHATLAQLFVTGADLRWEQAYAGRFIKPLVKPAEKKFIVNPIEKELIATPAEAVQAVAAVVSRRAAVAAAPAKPYMVVPTPTAYGLAPAPSSLPSMPSATAPLTPAQSNDILGVSTSGLAAAAPPAAAAAAVAAVQARVVALVCEATGFEATDVTPDLRLLDDLNLDSIKVGELIAQLAAEQGLSEEALDPSALANASIAELASAIATASAGSGGSSAAVITAAAPAAAAVVVPAAVAAPALTQESIWGGTVAAVPAPIVAAAPVMAPAASVVSTTPAAPSGASVAAVQARVVALVCEATGFEATDVTPDLRLLDDLNLDSIKVGELIAQLAAEQGLSEEALDPSALANASVNELAVAVAGASGGSTASASAPPATSASAFAAPAALAAGAAVATAATVGAVVAATHHSGSSSTTTSTVTRAVPVAVPVATPAVAAVQPAFQPAAAAPVSAAAAPAPAVAKAAPSGASAAAVQARVVALVCEATGFEATDVTPDLRLLDDLNLDSIKVGELIAQLAAEQGLSEEALDPSALANASIAELAQAVAGASGSTASSAAAPAISAAPLAVAPVAAVTAAVAAPAVAAVAAAPGLPPIAVPVAVAAAPSSAATAAVQQRIMELVTEATGFDQLSPDLRLLDDLNLDSIKVGELIAQLAAEQGLSEEALDPSSLANASIEELAQAVSGAAATGAQPASAAASAAAAASVASTPLVATPAASPVLPEAAAPSSAAEAAPSSASVAAVQARVVALVCEATGFEATDVTPDLRLLDDLNLDSIKVGELIAQLAAEQGLSEEALDPSALANASIAELAQAVAAAKSSGASAAPATGGSAAPVALAAGAAAAAGGLAAVAALASRNTAPVSVPAASAVAPAAPVAAAAPPAAVRAPAAAAPKPLAAPAAAPAAAPLTPAQVEEAYVKGRPTWVRDVTMKPRPMPLAAQTLAPHQLAPVGIVFGPQQAGAASELAAAIAPLVGNMPGCVRLVPLDAAGAYTGPAGPLAGCATAIVAMPSFATELPAGAGRSVEVAQLCTATLVSSLALLKKPLGSQAAMPASLLYVQSGTGNNSPAPAAGADLTSAMAFAASVHMERPALRVRCCDLPARLPAATSAGCLVDELTHGPTWVASGYAVGVGGAPVRHEPQISANDPRAYKPAPGAQALGPADVVLVTGGGKGITAACALALAQATGVQLALAGRSSPSSDQEVAGTLARMAAAGVRCQYYSVDVADGAAVRSLVEAVQRQQGGITGIVHGAAVQKLGRAEAFPLSSLLPMLAPKINGLLHLLGAVDQARLKLLAAYSSIIGSAGMTGSSWYAYSNEALNCICRSFKAAHPQCAVSAHGYGVWEEIGMGAKLGSVDTLGKMGIASLPVAQGVKHFLRLALNDTGVGSVSTVITARTVELDTMTPVPPPAAPRPLHFLERGRRLTMFPGVEHVVAFTLTNEDPFVRDHVYKGSFLMPTVWGLEAMAQVVAAATGRTGSGLGDWVEVRDLELTRPITAPPNGAPTTILAWAEVVEEEAGASGTAAAGGKLPVRVRAGLRTEATKFARDHFAAEFVLDGGMPEGEVHALTAAAATPVNGVNAVARLTAPAGAGRLPLDPESQLYGSGLLFQGPLYHRIGSVCTLEDRTPAPAGPLITAGVQLLQSADTVAGRDGLAKPGAAAKPAPLMLGDPYMHDAMLQASQLTVPDVVTLPMRVERWWFRAPGAVLTGPCPTVNMHMRREGPMLWNDCVTWDADGRLLSAFRSGTFKILGQRTPAVGARQLAAGPVPATFSDLNGPPGSGTPTPLDGKAVEQLAFPAPDASALIKSLADVAPAGVHIKAYRVPALPQLTPTQRRLHLELPLAQRLAEAAGLPGTSLAWDGAKPRGAVPPGALQSAAGGSAAAAPRAAPAASISHTGAQLVIALAPSPLGVDLEEIDAGRDEATWRRMLGPWAADLPRLTQGGDDLATAGTRLWGAKEALLKAAGAPSGQITAVDRHASGVVTLRVATAAGQFGIATSARAAAGPTRPGLVLAVCTPAAGTQPKAGSANGAAAAAAAVPLAAATGAAAVVKSTPVTKFALEPTRPTRKLGFFTKLAAKRYMSYLPSSFSLNYKYGCAEFGYPILFHDVSGADQHLAYTSYARIVSHAREAILPPAVNDEVARLMAQGRMETSVTRKCDILELEPPTFSDRELVVRVSSARDEKVHQYNEITMLLEILTASKPRRLLAVVRMVSNWVSFTPDGKADRARMPKPLQQFVDMGNKFAQWEWWGDERFGSAASAGRLGGQLWAAAGALPRTWPLLHSERYTTDITESNLALNVYWQNYPIFACRTLDRYTSALLRSLGRERQVTDGYFRPTQTNFNFMTDSSPGDEVMVEIRMSALHERGLRVTFVTSRVNADGSRGIKMNEGVSAVVWMDPKQGPAPIPADIRAAILAATAGSAANGSA